MAFMLYAMLIASTIALILSLFTMMIPLNCSFEMKRLEARGSALPQQAWH